MSGNVAVLSWVIAVALAPAAPESDSDRMEREAVLRARLSRTLLEEVPDVARRAAANSEESWLSLLRDLTGYSGDESADRQPHRSRRVVSATRSDVAALARYYVSSSFRSPAVDGLFRLIARECGVELPDSLAAQPETRNRGMGGVFVPVRPECPRIYEIARQASDPFCRAANEALSRNPSVAAEAAAALMQHGKSDVRLEALLLLAHVFQWEDAESSDASRAIVRALTDPDEGIRLQAVKAARLMQVDASEPILRALASAKDGKHRKEAVQALVSIGLKDSVGVFERALADEDAEFRRLGLRGLEKAMATASASKVIALLDDSSFEIRERAVGTLGTLRARIAFDRLRKLLGNPAFTSLAISALREIGDPAVASDLLPKVHDVDPHVRSASAAALASFGRAEVLEHADVLLDEHSVSTSAFCALNRFRRPEETKRLSEIRLKKLRYRGKKRDIIAEWQRETGVSIGFEVKDEFPRMKWHVRLPESGASILQALRELSRDPYIVESATEVRIVPWRDAREVWRRWFAERRGH
jgi:HEAT repeat protein